MTTESNVMTITTKGLSVASKKLINYATFDLSKITKVGNPLCTTDGKASSFSTVDYFSYSGLSLNSDNVIINFEGSYFPGDNNSCAFTLISSSVDSGDIRVLCSDTSIICYVGTTSVVNISDILLKPSDNIKIRLSINSATFTLSVSIANSAPFTSVGSYSGSIDLGNYASLYIGQDTASNENFWKGSIYLEKFAVHSDGLLVYSPSNLTDLKFTHLLISSRPGLTDTSIPVLNESYSAEITEVIRHANNILLKAYIGASVHLQIVELGLYAEVNGNKILFSTVPLQIIKEKDLGYELIFNVNIDINVVNTYVYPKIIMKEPEHAHKQDLEDIRKVYLNDVTDFERVIDENATELGYNRPQVFYALQDRIYHASDDWFACNSYNNTTAQLGQYNLTHYFHNSAPSKSTYTIQSLVNYAYKLNILDGLMKSNYTIVDFDSSAGFTLAVKVLLKDYYKDCLILAQIDTEDGTSNKYFTLEYKNQALIFTIFLSDSSFVISKSITKEDSYRLINTPFLLTLNRNSNNLAPAYSLYINDELVNVISDTSNSFISTSTNNFRLTNYYTLDDTPEFNFTDILTFNSYVPESAIRKLSYYLNTAF